VRPGDWALDPEGNQRRIAETFKAGARSPATTASAWPPRGDLLGRHAFLAADGRPLERVGEPQTVGFQADMAHTLLYTLGENAPEDRLLPENFQWSERATLDRAYRQLTDALRPWTNDFHVAQNDASVFGSGSHDHTGRHCLATDPNGKLEIPHHAGYWLRDETAN
jgi:hypothetical protein